MAKITALSVAGKKQGLRTGDELLSFDGFPFCDVLYILYYDAQ